MVGQMDVAAGSVVGKRFRCHRAREFLDFLNVIHARVTEDPDIQIVPDDHATHKTRGVKASLTRWPHWHVHIGLIPLLWLSLKFVALMDFGSKSFLKRTACGVSGMNERQRRCRLDCGIRIT